MLSLEVASLALFKKDKILVVRDRYEDFWTLPGGKVEKGETRREAV
ncbi:MAG: NUDIX domain-containing protein, partial [Patescibacteria group bacterium]